MKIKKIKGRVILNSRGEKTIEITVNKRFIGSAPIGASVGKHEVYPLSKKGIHLSFVNRTLHKALKGFRFEIFDDLNEIENTIFKYDNTEKLEKVGGNVVLALEYALLRAASNNDVWKFLDPKADNLPIPLGNCIGGGKHYRGESTEVQEFLLIPHGDSFKDNAFANHYIYKQVEKQLKPIGRNDEGAWITTLDVTTVLDLLKNLTEEFFENFDIFVGVGLDVAASSLHSGGFYFYKKGRLRREHQIKFINTLVSRYGLEYVEDPLDEEDFEGFSKIKCEMVCGDDLICTNLDRLKKADKNINSVIIKPNQIGSLIKTKQVVDWAKLNNITPVISHRSGETKDSIIADLAVGWNISFIKLGIFGKERLTKINRLKYIEDEIKKNQ
ncbi:hypothetical protein HYV88_03120 [Candidatus Woesearchaeota archaeon]|nr:hypothetical protein [Candidatus Woesearchaeota archaeon]